MSYYEAALTVLRDAREPMGAHEIAEEAMRRSLIEPTGRTPGNSMSATLYRYTVAGNRDIERVNEPNHSRRRRYALRKKG